MPPLGFGMGLAARPSHPPAWWPAGTVLAADEPRLPAGAAPASGPPAPRPATTSTAVNAAAATVPVGQRRIGRVFDDGSSVLVSVGAEGWPMPNRLHRRILRALIAA